MRSRPVFENVAMAKAILSRRGIAQGSPEWADYLRIREMCARAPGWVGLITRIRFVDGVDDFDELQSVLDVVTASGMDAGALTRMTYAQILDRFHDQLVARDGGADYEMVLRDDLYTIYRVHTYEGIMKIGSPSWCLKTKSNWDRYQAEYPLQFVAIHNEWVGKLMSPDSNYLGSYSNRARPWVRYGFSVAEEDGYASLPLIFDDNNNDVRLSRWNGHRELRSAIGDNILDHVFPIFLTICNIVNGNPVPGTTSLLYKNQAGPGLFSVTIGPGQGLLGNLSILLPGSNLEPIESMARPGDRVDVTYRYDKAYKKHYMVLLWMPVASRWTPEGISPSALLFHRGDFTGSWGVTPETNERMLDHYAQQDDRHTLGIRLERGLVTQSEVESTEGFLARIDDWLVFDWEEGDFTLLNATPSRGFNVPFMTLDKPGVFPEERTLVAWVEKDARPEGDLGGWMEGARLGMRRMGLFQNRRSWTLGILSSRPRPVRGFSLFGKKRKG